jgi:hypothetical protein
MISKFYYPDLEEDNGDLVNNEDFGFADLEDVDTKISRVCDRPSEHYFKTGVLLNLKYRECLNCGYSPDLDSCVEKYLECHKNFLEWERKNKV